MKTLNMIRTSMLMLLTGVMSVGFVACSDDDEPDDATVGIVNPSNVFTGDRPKSVSGVSIAYNAEGLAAEMITGSKRITFEYHNVTRAVNKQHYVKMTVVDEEYDGKFIFDMELNEKGFVKYCEQTEPDGDIETWDFGYTAEGNLNYMKRSEGGNEVTNMVYENGNIIKTSMASEEDSDVKHEYTISYTSDSVETPIENKGCLMLFDTTFGVDMDEMKYAYYAGLLGKATKHLPVKNNEDEFVWTLNNDGYPIEMNLESMYEDDTFTFEW